MRRHRPLGIARRIAATALGLVLLAHGVDLGGAARVLSAARAPWLTLAAAVTAVSITASVAQWGVLLRARAAVAWPRLGAAYARSLFVGHVVPGGFGGDASLTVELGAEHGHAEVVATLVASRLAGCVAMAAWSVAAAALLVPDLGVAPLFASLAVLAALTGLGVAALTARVRTAFDSSPARS